MSLLQGWDSRAFWNSRQVGVLLKGRCYKGVSEERAPTGTVRKMSGWRDWSGTHIGASSFHCSLTIPEYDGHMFEFCIKSRSRIFCYKDLEQFGEVLVI